MIELMRAFLVFALAAGLGLAQQDWQTSTSLAGVDLTGLTPAQKTTALKLLRESPCACGCDMKVAECRVKDPNCGVSRGIASTVVKDLKAGKATAAIAKELADIAKNGPPPPPILDEPVSISTDGDPVKGASNAKITVVEFSDFQCPYCAAAAAKVYAVLQQYPADVKLVFKQFPLDMHPQARIAAQASVAAQAQGKFWELHDKMFANFRQLNRERIIALAKETGLDMTRFTADLDSNQTKARVTRELQEGTNAGVSGTPTFFINGKKYNGAVEPERLKPLLDKELGR